MGISRAQVLIRLDAGMGVGFGHLSRCLAVADFLVADGVEVTFATAARTSDVLGRIQKAGCTTLLLPNRTEDAPAGIWDDKWQLEDALAIIGRSPAQGWDAVIVDHYQLDRTWEALMRQHTKRMVVIDDLANRCHEAGVLVDHNWYGEHTGDRYSTLVGEECLLLLGPRYAMLHPSYAFARLERPPRRKPPQTVVVSFGGTDAGRQTQLAVSALLSVSDVELDVVVGTERALTPELKRVAENPRVRLHVGLPTMIAPLAHADLAIGASGTATWERLCLGVPALVTTVREEQAGVTRAFDAAGITRWLGNAADVSESDYRRAFLEVLDGRCPDALPIVDGYGAARVALAVLPHRRRELGFRQASVGDEPTFVTSAPTEDQSPAGWRDRSAKFSRLMAAGDSLEIVELRGTPVGIQYEENGHVCEWVDPSVSHISTKESK